MKVSSIHSKIYHNLSLIADDEEKMQQVCDFTDKLIQSSQIRNCDEDCRGNALNQDDINDRFNIFLDIEGSSSENQEIIIDPYQTIRELIYNIVKALKLPPFDNGENPIQYLLAKPVQDDDEPSLILDFEDEDGREQNILDYGVQPGDRIFVISVPIAGGRPQMEISYLPAKRNLFQRLLGINSKVSFASAFVPDSICRKSSMMIQVYLYNDGERDKVCAEATQCHHITREKAFAPLHTKLKAGDKVNVHLRIQGLEIERTPKTIIWQGHYTKACFYVRIDDEWKDDKLYGEIFISINDTMIGELDFITNVTSSYVEVEKTANIISRQYKKIFISYAHQDESKVKYIAEAYRAQGINYFFDRHYLRGGDIFPLIIQNYINNADLFLLCWSENAAKSDYVEKERNQALQRAFPIVPPSEESRLTIYPVSIEPYAELPEDMKDYYNFEQL